MARAALATDGALAPFRFCDANMMFAFSFFLFGALRGRGIPCISGLPPGVGRVDCVCWFMGGVGPFGRLGWADGPPSCSRDSFEGMGPFIGRS